MKSKAPPPTKAQRERNNRVMQMGCVVSRLRRTLGQEVPFQGTELHHLTKARKRLGHGYTICLAKWYHSGQLPPGIADKATARMRFGASIADGSKVFIASHGATEIELWELTQHGLNMVPVLPPTKIFPRRVS